MRRLYNSLPICITLFLSSTISAQLISGKLISERGFKASGISVKFKNKSNAVISNEDGTFKIMATSLPDTLVFSAVGYEPYKVIVTEKTVKDPNFEIVLLEARSKLDETTIGYSMGMADLGALRKETKAYSSAKVSEKELRDFSADLLEERSSGIYIDSKDKAGAASVRIRGASAGSARSSSDDYAPYRGNRFGKKTYLSDSTIPTKEITRRSQLLTAGEVNDFKKWKMWEDYNATEFKSMSTYWQLFPTHRYSLQLQNKEHTEIVGQQVYLINRETNDTVWKAVTDNTGKAELWGGFNQKDSGNYSIAINNQNGISSPSEFGNGMNTKQINKSCNTSNKVEIAFVVDATGSMGDEIEYLKLELEDVIRSTFEKNTAFDLKVGSVFYRDKGDEYLTKHVDFNSDLLKVLNFIKLQRAAGGGDGPEAVNSALRTAVDSLSWSDDTRSKILFLVMDAQPHKETAGEMFELIQIAAARGIRIVPIACSGTDKSTEFIMRSIALATNGTYLFLTDNSGVGGAHIKPTTDAYNVELLSELLSRTIEQMIFIHPCAEKSIVQEPYKPRENISNITLYPNPTKGKLTIETTTTLKELYVTDFTGKILMRINVKDKSKNYRVDISQYPSATYFIGYVTDDNRWGAEKVILIH